MVFEHEGVRVTHPKLAAAFLRGVRFADEEGVFVVQLGRFRGQIEVEDCPWWVTSYDPQSGHIQLTDGSAEPLAAASLRVDPDEALRVTVKGRFPARFTRAGQAHLLDAVEFRDGIPVLRSGSRHHALPQLASALGRG